MEASLAAETGFSSHPLLSVKKWEENLTKLASLSWSRVWNALRLGGEPKRDERWSLRESHVRRRKMARRKGKAWGLLRKKTREERDEARVSEEWLPIGLGCELLLGFTIILDQIWRSDTPTMTVCVSAPDHSLSLNHDWASMVQLLRPGPAQSIVQEKPVSSRFMLSTKNAAVTESRKLSVAFGHWSYHITN